MWVGGRTGGGGGREAGEEGGEGGVGGGGRWIGVRGRGEAEETWSLEGSSPPDVKGGWNKVARTLVCLVVRRGANVGVIS